LRPDRSTAPAIAGPIEDRGRVTYSSLSRRRDYRVTRVPPIPRGPHQPKLLLKRPV
jgi:hypothetical protein